MHATSPLRGLQRAARALLLWLVAGVPAAVGADIVIGVPNWPSVNVTAHIIKVILEDNFGLQVELQAASNPVIFEAMARGSMQIHPEVWLPNQQALYERAAAALALNRHAAIGIQGICANRSARAAGIRDISDLSDPAKARLLDTDGDRRGSLFIGAPGWSSTRVERNKARAYGYDQLLDLAELDEGLAASQLAIAQRRGKPWAGYCYTPHHLFVLYPDLGLLGEPPFDAARWQPSVAGSSLDPSAVAMAWPPQRVQPVYAKSLARSYPMAATLMDNLDMNTEDMSRFAWELVVNKRDAGEFARIWIGEHRARVAGWMR